MEEAQHLLQEVAVLFEEVELLLQEMAVLFEEVQFLSQEVAVLFEEVWLPIEIVALHFRMSKARLETFTDGVIAILITIMVLELRVPHGADWSALRPLVPLLLSYALSFIFLGIYWNNHHHMFQTVDRINGRIMWANMHLLFWLSLVPFATGWMGENDFASLPTALYGFVLLMAAISYTILVYAIIAHQGAHSKLRAAIGKDRKGMISMALYVAAIPLAFVHREIAWAIFVIVALIWLAPDRRIEDKIESGALAHDERGGAE